MADQFLKCKSFFFFQLLTITHAVNIIDDAGYELIYFVFGQMNRFDLFEQTFSS